MPNKYQLPTLSLLCLLAVQYVHIAHGHSNGLGITGACTTLVPGHGVFTQNSPSPFQITFTPRTYTAGAFVSVTLSTCTGAGFKGFLIQARAADKSQDQTLPIGRFVPILNTRQTCSGNQGLVHTEGSVKTSKTFSWQAPQAAVGHVIFRVTFVRNIQTFWADVKSEVLLDATINNPLDPSSVTSPTSLDPSCSTGGGGPVTTQRVTNAPTPQPTTTRQTSGLVQPTSGSGSSVTRLSNGNFAQDSACGATKTCYSDCDDTNGCTFQVAWREVGDSGEYTLTTKLSASDIWMAVGFSSDQTMGGDSVTGCKYTGGNAEVFNAKNPAPFTPPTMLSSEGISLSSSEYANGFFSCTFLRLKAEGINGDRFDLTSPWYMMFARGNLNAGGSLAYHQPANRFVSSQQFTVSGSGNQGPQVTNPAPTTAAPSTGSVVKDTECGVSKGCFSDCEGSACSYVASWMEDGNDAVYTLRSDIASDTGAWIAVAFSADGDMGDDNVLGCLVGSDGTVIPFNGQNTGKSPPTMYPDNQITLESSQNADGVLTCTVRRPKDARVDTKRVDVNEAWTLLFARGLGSINAGSPSIQYHNPNNRFISPAAYKASDILDSVAKDDKRPLIKAHGGLMIGAWIFLASVGIVAARHLKPSWKDMLCSQKVWFQIHRTCMVLVFCTTVAGFVIIFVEVEGWSELIESKEHLEAHPIMGVIVTGLTVLNPIMAFFRPHPGTSKRPIFNWAHWFVGTAAHVLGIVTIFFGVQLGKADAPDYLIYILAGYCAWQIFIELLLGIVSYCGRRKDRREIYELSGGDAAKANNLGTESEGASSLKKVLFGIHVFVCAALAGVVIALVAVGEKELES